MQSGVLYGYLGLVEGTIARMKQEMGEGVRVVATGGLARVIAPQTQMIDHLDPDLTLHGLRIIHELNSPRV
jgi:type III pantothenate kinase